MDELAFRKVEGLGNDFLLVDLRGRRTDELGPLLERLAAAAPRLCHRRTGVGGDGLLLVTDTEGVEADGRMIVINHDGSRPEMCGNGLRCVAQQVARTDGTLRLQTDAGVLECRVSHWSPEAAQVQVHMGPARDLGSAQPAAGAGRSFRGVSMGNPHAIAFVEDSEDPEALARQLGPGLEIDPAYPDRTNVEFCRVADTTLTLWVWERGCGITGACGTGACATAAAAVWAGHAPAATPLEVRLPGGSLSIEVPEDRSEDVIMTGPARLAFTGVISLQV